MRRFANPGGAALPHDLADVLRWALWEPLLRRRAIDPAGPPAPRVAAELRRIHDPGGAPRLTWIGHSSFLGSLAGASFLIDPVFSDRVGWLLRRHVAPGIAARSLPKLEALLVSHNHYDHLDEPSIHVLARDLSVFVPQGLGRWFGRRGFEHVTELGWWETKEAGPLRVTLVPARHWSRRTLTDTNRSHWGGFVIEGGGSAFYHGGDSAWFDGFAEIGRRFPSLTAAMLPVGAYAPAWFMERHHMTPEQAGRAFLEVGARLLIPMHWGAFKLADESLGAPVERLRTWWSQNVMEDSRRLRVLAVGETVVFDGCKSADGAAPGRDFDGRATRGAV